MPDPVPPPAAPAPVPPPPPPPPPPAAPAPPPATEMLSFDEFKKMKLVTAEIVSAVAHPKADKLVIMQIKIGERTKQIVAGIRKFYLPEQLVGKTIIVVDNLHPVKLRGEDSFGMLLAVTLPDGGLRLLTTDGPAPSGMPVS